MFRSRYRVGGKMDLIVIEVLLGKNDRGRGGLVIWGYMYGSGYDVGLCSLSWFRNEGKIWGF